MLPEGWPNRWARWFGRQRRGRDRSSPPLGAGSRPVEVEVTLLSVARGAGPTWSKHLRPSLSGITLSYMEDVCGGGGWGGGCWNNEGIKGRSLISYRYYILCLYRGSFHPLSAVLGSISANGAPSQRETLPSGGLRLERD